MNDRMNPFEPPATTLADPALPPGSAVKAVSLGLLVDIAGTLAASTVLGIVYAAFLTATGEPEDQVPELLESAFQDGWGFVVGTVLGCGFSVLGGYVCARISRRQDMKLPLVLAALSIGIGVLLAGSAYSVVRDVALACLTVACVLAGAKLGLRRVARRDAT